MHVPPSVVYLVICGVVGWLGARSPFGFWGSFLGSVLVTPLLAMMVLLFMASFDKGSSDD